MQKAQQDIYDGVKIRKSTVFYIEAKLTQTFSVHEEY